VKKYPRVIFLESRQGLESLFTRGLRSGATAAGWEAEIIFLADASGQARTEKEVRSELLEKKPDTVCFLMDAPLELKYLWDAPSLAAVDKISLWFDDYYRSPKTLAHPEIWTDWQKNHGVRVGIWDGYWRCQWKKLTGVEAFPIHLAADPRLLRPQAEPWNQAWSERAVFVGTIPSLKSLNTFAEAFPAPLRRFLEEVCEAMRGAAWPIKPYELSQKIRSFTGIKYGRAIDAMLKDPATLALWNHLLWRWGKRITRLRGLSAVAQAGPLAILSGHGTECYAGEEELRAALPPEIDLVYADTSTVAASSWKGLFRTGKFQVQITDPQSIEGGLPFRVFECAACGVPLLSDYRPELAALFPPESGLVTASSEASLRENAARLFQTPKRDLERQGQLLHQSFLAQHTWEIRWRQLTLGNEPRIETVPLPVVPYRLVPDEKPLMPRPLDRFQTEAHNQLCVTASQPIKRPNLT
jgi:Glycosyl transferases group 1